MSREDPYSEVEAQFFESLKTVKKENEEFKQSKARKTSQ
jgi:hypothetical protein